MTDLLLVLDFDGVLFNDTRFKRDYERLFARRGVPSRVHRAAYDESRVLHPGGYDHHLHLTLIRKRVPSVKIPDMERAVQTLLIRAEDYFYGDTLPFLRYWQSKKERLALLSSGLIFQKKKVRASGVARFCKPAIVADTVDKVAPLRALMDAGDTPEREIIFIDDKKSIVDAVKQNFPRATVIQIARYQKQERSARADAVVSNLAAARRFIDKVSH